MFGHVICILHILHKWYIYISHLSLSPKTRQMRREEPQIKSNSSLHDWRYFGALNRRFRCLYSCPLQSTEQDQASLYHLPTNLRHWLPSFRYAFSWGFCLGLRLSSLSKSPLFAF